MTKVQLLIMAYGSVLLVGAWLFYRVYTRNQTESQFREDVWKDPIKVKQQKEVKQAYEDQLDKKILLEHRPDPADAAAEAEVEKEKTKDAPPYKLPNFRGMPHEILGIASTADAETISKAHKHWIKRYHPDRVTHLGGQYIEQARRRAEQLNTAKKALLDALARRKI